MASFHTKADGRIEIKVKSAKKFVGFIPSRVFEAHEADKARAWGEAAEGMLRQGQVPAELLERRPRGGDKTSTSLRGRSAGITDANGLDEGASEAEIAQTYLKSIFEQYTAARRVSPSDVALHKLIEEETGNPRLGEMTLQWAGKLVESYKTRKSPMAPGSIRKRIGALTRAVDWFQQQTGRKNSISFGSALGRGYSQYAQGEVKDKTRTRFFQKGEEAKLIATMNGQTLEGTPSRMQLGDLSTPAMRCLFNVLRHGGLRLKEAYTLRVSQIDIAKRLIHVNGSKGHYGAEKPRTVPMKAVVRDALEAAIAGKAPTELVFPYWDGQNTDASHKRASVYLSQLFSRLFTASGVYNMTTHDLRHIATADWVSMRHPESHTWLFSESELMQMMGWTSRTMLDRYLKGFRADDFASRISVLD